MKAKPDEFPYMGLREPWTNNPNSIWLASTLQLYRNVKGRCFPNQLNEAERAEVRGRLEKALAKTPELKAGYTVAAEEIGPLEKEFLHEHFLAPQSFQQAMSGDGFVIGPHGKIFAVINVRNHLLLQITDTQEQLEDGWNRLAAIEIAVGKQQPFSYSSRFGYLTADPYQSGTAMVANLYLHTPALIHMEALDETLERLGMDEVEVASITGDPAARTGDLLAIRNRCTLGLSEDHILQIMRAFGLKLTLAERRARKTLAEVKDPHLMDLVSRAYGLVAHSYQLETIEAWNALSFLKLGLDTGWVVGVTHQVLNELIFDCRRAHLVSQYTEEIAQEELAHRRAEFIHASLAAAQLAI